MKMEYSQAGHCHCREGIVGNFFRQGRMPSLLGAGYGWNLPAKGFQEADQVVWFLKFCISKYKLTLRSVSLGKKSGFSLWFILIPKH